MAPILKDLLTITQQSLEWKYVPSVMEIQME